MVARLFSRRHGGMRDWLLQRITAVFMTLYLVALGTILITHRPGQYAAWKTMFSPIWLRTATLLFLYSLFLHAWLGVRDILNDYVHPLPLRSFLQRAVLLALTAYAAWALNILWSVR